jgi:hypothetical protein
MESLHIIESRTTPEIQFDLDQGKYLIRGRSIPSDANSFFSPLERWVDDFAQTAPEGVYQVDVRLEHLNTGSVRSLLTIFFKLTRLDDSGRKVQVNWYYEEDDEDMMDKGEELSLILERPFSYISFRDQSY